MATATHRVGPRQTGLASNGRAEPITPDPHCLVATIDPALEMQIFKTSG